MIPVVNREPSRKLEIGAAAAAGSGSELMRDDFPARAHDPPLPRARQTRAHDMHRSGRHHMMP